MPPRVIRETKVSRVFREKLVHRVKLEPLELRARLVLQVQPELPAQTVFQSSGLVVLLLHLLIRLDSTPTTTQRQDVHTSTMEQSGHCLPPRETKEIRENKERPDRKARRVNRVRRENLEQPETMELQLPGRAA